jgi:hypothetical protein
MTDRFDIRAQYIRGWETMDAGLLLGSVAPDFLFDDPADPAPIPKSGLAAYMPVWPDRARALGAEFDFRITDKLDTRKNLAAFLDL